MNAQKFFQALAEYLPIRSQSSGGQTQGLLLNGENLPYYADNSQLLEETFSLALATGNSTATTSETLTSGRGPVKALSLIMGGAGTEQAQFEDLQDTTITLAVNGTNVLENVPALEYSRFFSDDRPIYLAAYPMQASIDLTAEKASGSWASDFQIYATFYYVPLNA